MSLEDENSSLKEAVTPDTELKNIIVEYVGDKVNPEGDEVTLEMVVETLATDFPDVVIALAEENWIRGYRQALEDAESARKLIEKEMEEMGDEFPGKKTPSETEGEHDLSSTPSDE